MDNVTNHLLKVFVSSQMRKKGVLPVDELKAQKDQQSNSFGMGPVRGNGGDAAKTILDTMREF